MEDAGENEGPSQVRMLSAGALRALAHPIRVQIYDILSQFGPQTATSLAERLGESSGVTSYHLRALAKQELIREVPDRGTARERWWERPRGAVSITSPEAVKTPSGRAATQVVVSEFYRRRNEQLVDYINSQMQVDPAEWLGLFQTATLRLTFEQFEEFSNQVEALVDEAGRRYRDQTGEGVRTYSVRADIFPIDTEEKP